VGGSPDISTAIDPSSAGIFDLTSSSSLEVAAPLGTKTRIGFAAGSDLIIDDPGSFGINVESTAYAGPLLEHFGSGEASIPGIFQRPGP
jgi:hypothetical protein